MSKSKLILDAIWKHSHMIGLMQILLSIEKKKSVLFSSSFFSSSHLNSHRFLLQLERKEFLNALHFKLCFYIFNLFLIISFSEPKNYGLVLMLNFERDILKKINSFIFLRSKNWTLQLYSFLSFILFYEILQLFASKILPIDS